VIQEIPARERVLKGFQVSGREITVLAGKFCSYRPSASPMSYSFGTVHCSVNDYSFAQLKLGCFCGRFSLFIPQVILLVIGRNKMRMANATVSREGSGYIGSGSMHATPKRPIFPSPASSPDLATCMRFRRSMRQTHFSLNPPHSISQMQYIQCTLY
jgi:hypothetical protein